MAAVVVLLAMGILAGCSKDEIIDTCKHAIQEAGDGKLIGNWSLEELPLTMKQKMKLRSLVS